MTFRVFSGDSILQKGVFFVASRFWPFLHKNHVNKNNTIYCRNQGKALLIARFLVGSIRLCLRNEKKCLKVPEFNLFFSFLDLFGKNRITDFEASSGTIVSASLLKFFVMHSQKLISSIVVDPWSCFNLFESCSGRSWFAWFWSIITCWILWVVEVPWQSSKIWILLILWRKHFVIECFVHV